MIVIGIDPGQKTGVAKFRNGKLIALCTVSPVDIALYFAWLAESDVVVFEDSRLQSVVFSRGKMATAAKLKIARNIGEIDGICKLIDGVCAEIGGHTRIVRISPKAKGAKVNAATFAKLTGWRGQSNQHERDAAMCVIRSGVITPQAAPHILILGES